MSCVVYLGIQHVMKMATFSQLSHGTTGTPTKFQPHTFETFDSYPMGQRVRLQSFNPIHSKLLTAIPWDNGYAYKVSTPYIRNF